MNSELTFESVLAKSGTGEGAISHTDGKEYLRHRHPMLRLDRVADRSFEEGWIHAIRAISCSDPVFEGHFPDSGVYPGTCINQDINQVAITLFVGMTSPLTKDGGKQEITAVKDIVSNFGHPVPPGCLLDIAVWATGQEGKKNIRFKFEARVRDFPFYDKANKYGLTFEPAISGEGTLIRTKRKFYDGIWF